MRAVHGVGLDQLTEHAQRREGTPSQGGTFHEQRFLSSNFLQFRALW